MCTVLVSLGSLAIPSAPSSPSFFPSLLRSAPFLFSLPFAFHLSYTHIHMDSSLSSIRGSSEDHHCAPYKTADSGINNSVAANAATPDLTPSPPQHDLPPTVEKKAVDSNKSHPAPLPIKEESTPAQPRATQDSDDPDSSSNSILDTAVRFLASRDDRERTIAAAVIGLVVVRYSLLTFLNWTTILVAVLSMGLGGFVAAFYLLAAPETTRLKRASAIANFGKHHDQRFEIVDGVPSWPTVSQKDDPVPESTSLAVGKSVDLQRVNISPEIDPVVEEMISYTLRDFVNVPVGLVAVGQHNVPLRASLVAMAMNLSSRLTNMRLPETALLAVFGLQNNFIVHLRAYRELRASRMPIEQYVSTHANPDSVLGRCYHKEERLKQFRSTAKAVCQALVSKNDQQSVALFAVMQEIMATHVLESTLEHVCDPDYINLSIIDYFESSANDSKATPDGAGNDHKGSASGGKAKGVATKTEEPAISALADSILMNAAHLMDKTSSLQKQGSASDLNTPVSASTPRQDFTPSQPTSPSSAFDEVNAFDRLAATEATKIQPAVTLKQVLIHKSDHIDLYQEFMAYLQVWDAMDLVQFWLMIDIFHRQIEQGTLSDLDDLRREAASIFESYCGPDQDQNVAGIRDAHGGALLKNIKKKIQRDPAHCFVESQEWALHILESQYWMPFEIKKENEMLTKKRSESSLTHESAASAPNTNTTTAVLTNGSSPLEGALPDIQLHSTENHSPPLLSLAIPPKIPHTSTEGAAKSPTSPVSVSRPVVQAIHISDMVNRRPKTLMSNADLSYMIEVQTENGQGWMITRTFQQLEQLQASLVQQFPVVQRAVFPRWRLQPSDKVCNGLQNFMRSMLAIPEVSESSKLAWFLSKEYDQTPQESSAASATGLSSGLASTFSLASTEQNMTALGQSAAQGAKTALRQASEASLTAGRFFKSLGAAVGGSASSPQLLPEDRTSSRGSFESIRSVRSVSSTLTLSEQNQQHQQQPFNPIHGNGVGISSSSSSLSQASRPLDSASDRHVRMSSSSDYPRVHHKATENQSPSPTPIATTQRQDSDLNASTPAQTIGSNHCVIGLGLHPQSVPMTHGQSGQSLQLQTRPSSPASTTAPALPPTAPTITTTSDSTAVTTGSSTVIPSQQQQQQQQPLLPKKTPKISLLSNDELDLLIETSFTVLEDMMDFSKGQSIRRMTFGMLRELVRKSYRVAINESFSAWVEQNSSHEKAVEMVKWMKDDFFWPNGEWPTVPAPSPSPAPPASSTVPSGSVSGSAVAKRSSASSLASSQSTVVADEKKDLLHIGDDVYEVGSDGIAVKVSHPTTATTVTPTPSTLPAATTTTETVVDTPITRTLAEKEATREKARGLVKMMLPGSLVTVLGREAVLRGLVDVFEMFQIKELNQGLALSVLEMTVRLILTR
ncbi:hypothetical protein KVV02_004599 [Mortierella alpina]|uniref:PXA domain-containing protein n=1 Tax=Mortierella alpina TaxID=64518 RepID=A0A9P8D1L6_MORAP|nr:hypothetical protein KVV02_004599 [Mortierella alpina]